MRTVSQKAAAKVGVAAISCCLHFAVTAALAADLSPTPVFKGAVAQTVDWTGFFVGAHIGSAWADNKNFDPTGGNFLLAGDFLNAKGSAVAAGAQIGFNSQIANWVFGLEGSYSWTDIEASLVNPVFGGGGQMTHGVDTKWMATATGRVGYAWDRWLVYGKAGAAWARYDYHMVLTGGPILPFSLSDVRQGWLLGAGIELALDSGWSARIEYNYMDFGRFRGTFATLPPVPIEVDQHIQVVKFAANYRFAWPGARIQK